MTWNVQITSIEMMGNAFTDEIHTFITFFFLL